ncbi:MAG: DUF58 domain-containing protein [Methylacidiphilales bacterium]|nr:DUF58 domain-containing protein [Candidatus Methylacidiphilales bacterium]
MEKSARHELLDPDALARGEALGIMARTVVEGYRVGEHRSPFRGFAIEFAQHREYTVGDDLRHLDWKVLGKTDRYYIKQYEQDTNFVASIALDGSASMNYGSGKLSKFQYAKALAACLAYLVVLQGDSVSLQLFDERIRETAQRTDNVGKLLLIMDQLAAFETRETTHLGNSLNDLAQMIRSRGIIILISDFFDDEASIEAGIQRLRFGGSEVIVFHVLDACELEFPFQGMVEFIGLEGGARLKIAPADLRKSYLKTFNEYRERIRSICDHAGCHYVLVNTEKTLAEILSEYLAFRHKVTSR